MRRHGSAYHDLLEVLTRKLLAAAECNPGRAARHRLSPGPITRTETLEALHFVWTRLRDPESIQAGLRVVDRLLYPAHHTELDLEQLCAAPWGRRLPIPSALTRALWTGDGVAIGVPRQNYCPQARLQRLRTIVRDDTFLLYMLEVLERALVDGDPSSEVLLRFLNDRQRFNPADVLVAVLRDYARLGPGRTDQRSVDALRKRLTALATLWDEARPPLG